MLGIRPEWLLALVSPHDLLIFGGCERNTEWLAGEVLGTLG